MPMRKEGRDADEEGGKRCRRGRREETEAQSSRSSAACLNMVSAVVAAVVSGEEVPRPGGRQTLQRWIVGSWRRMNQMLRSR